MKVALLLLFSLPVAIAIPLAKTHYTAEGITKEQIDVMIRSQAKLIADSQAKHDVPFIPGVSWHFQKGNYPHKVFMNVFGGVDANFIRTNMMYPDDGHYVCSFVTQYLLEASLLIDEPTEVVSEDQLVSSVEFAEDFKDRNFPNTTAIVYWSQKYNETSGLWYVYPENIAHIAPFLVRGGRLLNNIFDLAPFKLSHNYQALLDVIEYFGYLRFPSDFDNTFIYFGIGPLLKSSKFESASEAWIKNNPNAMSAVKFLSKYAYRPFSNDSNSNRIVPHTFYYMRKFLWDLEAHRRTDFAVPVVWLYNYDDSFGERVDSFNIMLYENNVDVIGAANILHGIAGAILNDMYNPDEWFTDDIQGIYRDTVDLTAYLVTHNLTGRWDLALLGYPQVIQAMYLLSRPLKILAAEQNLPYPVLETAKETLANALRTNGTDLILQNSHQDWDGLVYFDGFLGNGDVDITGKPIQRHQDRIFITSSAINALLNIWTEQGKFVSTMSEDLKITISLAVQWLIKNLDNEEYGLNNCFGGYLGLIYDNYIWNFPSNDYNWINKTNVSSDFELRTQSELLKFQAAVKGVIDQEEYDKMLQENFLGSEIYQDFQGYNSKKDGHFVCWNSIPISRASITLALANYRRYYL